MINRPRSAQAGFTLIELLSVIVIMVLLMAAISPSLGNFTVKAKLASTKVNCRVVQSVITGYSTDHNGDIPTSRAQYYSSPTFQNLYNPFNN
ncbi:MAG: type II secretion system protein, partial [Nevskia sp.]|nr:type II secretion system protein [Nevskia sp.]